MGGLLAIDAATMLGWTFGPIPRRSLTPLEMATARLPQPLSGTVRIGRPGCGIGEFVDAAEKWAGTMMERHRPGGLIIERPILPSATKDQNGRLKSQTNPMTVCKLNSLVGVILMVAYRFGVGWVREAQPSSVKKFICGSGAPGKLGVQEAVRSFGWTFADDNEADAEALWVYGCDLARREQAGAA